MSDVRSLLNNVDILGLSETKLDDSFPDAQFKFHNLKLYRSDRNCHGGGLIMFVNSKLPSRERRDLIDWNTNGVECIIVEVSAKNEKIFFILVYKPPQVKNIHINDSVSRIIDKCAVMCESLYIIGDFNIDLGQCTHAMTDMFEMYDLVNIINRPTCFKNVHNPSTLDGIITNSPQRILTHFNLFNDISDCHNLIGAVTRMKAPLAAPRKITYRSYKHFDEKNYLKDLSITPFHVSDIFENPNDQMWCHNKLLSDVINLHAPIKHKTVKTKKLPYMNGELRKAINVKSMLLRKYYKNRNSHTWNNYRKQRNLVNSLKRITIKRYFQDKCSDKNSNNFWKTDSRFFSNKSATAAEIHLFENGQITTDPKSVAEILNDHYINVTNNVSEPEAIRNMSVNDIIHFYESHPSVSQIKQHIGHQSNLEFESVKLEDVRTKLKGLATKKSVGYDMIPARLLKIGANVLCRSLTKVFNNSIHQGIFPECLKRAIICPVYKKGDCFDKNNYRPISLLTNISKVFEGLLCDQILSYLTDTLSEHLSAYRKTFSCENVVLKCVENWKHALDNNEVIGCVLIDLSKAFDSVPHGLLLTKLFHHGMSRNATELIKDYLTHRPQCVRQDKELSSWRHLKRGVPQGSLLGPTLFNIFINDLLLMLQNKCLLYNYADDNSLAFRDNDQDVVKENIEHVLALSIKWFENNYMQVNPSKFQSMVLSKKNCDISFNVNGAPLQVSKSVKLLGCYVDNQLKFSEHVKHLSVKCSKQVNALARLSSRLDSSTKLKIIQCLVFSNMKYCDIVYHYCSVKDARKLEKLFHRALKYAFHDFTSDYKKLLERANFSMLYINRLRNIVICIHKIRMKCLYPVDNDFLTEKDVAYNLRNANLIQPQCHTVSYGYQSLRYNGVSLYNKLPSQLKALSVCDFKENVRFWSPECKCNSCIMCTL